MLERAEWMQQAACKGKPLDWFFQPETLTKFLWEQTLRPKARLVCAGCPVANECLTEALDTREPYGVRGGFDAGERIEISKKRKAVFLEVRFCGFRECRKRFVAVNNQELYCSTACRSAEKRADARQKAHAARVWRAKQKAERTGELFDVESLRAHTYVQLAARVADVRDRKEGVS